MKLEKYSIGIGDRFACQGKAQLRSIMKAEESGVQVVPVWNKSHREHTTIGTAPGDVRREADSAVKELGWKASYYVDADHIGLATVDLFVDSSDFFTIDVADFIGRAANEKDVQAFLKKHAGLAGKLRIPGIEESIEITAEQIEATAQKFLLAINEAGKIYRHIEKVKGKGKFIAEVSMDETDQPQTPVEMLLILRGIADAGIPVQTIAPKFTGRFNKGVDYVGDLGQFAQEFEADLAVIDFAVREFGLPENLKLSVHSGSDKFSIYPIIHRAIAKFGAGLHVKTAGTTWLEELIGLSLAGERGLAVARDVYKAAHARFDELCAPYAQVIDIDKARLPSLDVVAGWSGGEYAAALRHDPSCSAYNPHFRQLLHVGYKVAAKMGEQYLNAVRESEETIARNVTENLFDRHLKPIFIG